MQVGKDKWRARAEILSPEQRADIWPRITAAWPNFTAYQKKTSRLIPVVRLVRQ